jgi:TolB-like protein
MKIKHNLTTLFYAALASCALASDPPPAALSVAVYDFKGDGPAASFGNNVTALVTANLATESNIIMLERAELNKALSEQAFGVSGLVSSDAAAKIGLMTGAKVLVAGEVMKIGENHLVIVADIIGTETGRLFADKVEGAPDKLMDLTSELSRQIARTISDHVSNLVASAQSSREERLERIIKSIAGTNRPSVSVDILQSSQPHHHIATESVLGALLLKAGFKVVDAKSDRKPDVVITGINNSSPGPKQGGLFTYRTVLDVKVQERRTGAIIAFEHEAGSATDATLAGADRGAVVNAVDALAEKVLPLLAK